MQKRDSKGRFVAKRKTRRNPDGAGYLAGGKFHPVRAWAGYDPARVGETKRKATGKKMARAPRTLVETLKRRHRAYKQAQRLRMEYPKLSESEWEGDARHYSPALKRRFPTYARYSSYAAGVAKRARTLREAWETTSKEAYRHMMALPEGPERARFAAQVGDSFR